ncbi:MAG: DUF4411 family protein [Lachnospiraceae bacterium]|nr:DUF4411 family protein [Lachnospiraceae bacterium]
MIDKTEKFLVDSNSFMTPYRFYYAFDLVPAYWKALEQHIKSGRIVVLDMVKDEIDKGKDELATWLNTVKGLEVVPHVSTEIVTKYQEVLQYVQGSGLYKPEAFQIWAPGYIADPWIIAAASAHSYTIVTEEKSSGGLSIKTPNRAAKIPDVAHHFGARAIDIYEMMRKLNIKIE